MARPANSWMGIDVAMLSPNDLEDECDKRLKWLFSNYGVDNLSDLGLRLISEYCDWFSPVYRPEPQTGGSSDRVSQQAQGYKENCHPGSLRALSVPF
jgi:hypothetical protein